MKNILDGQFDLRTTMVCNSCGETGRPLLRIWGMPTPEAEKSAMAGRCTFMGCSLPLESEPVADYECRHCGADAWVYRHL